MDTSGHYIAHALVPGTVNIFSGPTHAGKTTLLTELVSCVARGKPFFGVPTKAPAAVGYVALDHSWALYHQLFTDAGFTDLASYSLADDKQGSYKRFSRTAEVGPTEAFMELLRGVWPQGAPRGSLLVVDPVHLLTGKDINSYVPVAVALGDIGIVCREMDICVIATAHTAKPSADKSKGYARAIDKAAGSTAMAGYSRTMMNLSPPEENGTDYFEFSMSCRTAPEIKLLLTRDTEDGRFEKAIETEADPALKLHNIFHPGELITWSELIERSRALLGFSKATTARYVRGLKANGLIMKLDKLYTWQGES